jgi:membrane associated rhomboid family serine protease
MRWGPPPPPRGGGGGGGGYNIVGVFIPKPVAWLIALVIGMSAFGALLERAGLPILSLSVLDVRRVFAGEIWRLVTWAPLEFRGALGLLLGCLTLYFFTPDLIRRWGTRWFFLRFFGCATLVAVITCLIGRFVWSDVAAIPHGGVWPMNEALIITWAALFRDRQILLMMAIPMGGRNLIYVTIAMTIIIAALYGFALFVPHFVAEAIALAYMDVIPVRRSVARARLAWFQRSYKKRTEKFTRIDRDDPPRWTH